MSLRNKITLSGGLLLLLVILSFIGYKSFQFVISLGFPSCLASITHGMELAIDQNEIVRRKIVVGEEWRLLSEDEALFLFDVIRNTTDCKNFQNLAKGRSKNGDVIRIRARRTDAGPEVMIENFD